VHADDMAVKGKRQLKQRRKKMAGRMFRVNHFATSAKTSHHKENEAPEKKRRSN